MLLEAGRKRNKRSIRDCTGRGVLGPFAREHRRSVLRSLCTVLKRRHCVPFCFFGQASWNGPEAGLADIVFKMCLVPDPRKRSSFHDIHDALMRVKSALHDRASAAPSTVLIRGASLDELLEGELVVLL